MSALVVGVVLDCGGEEGVDEGRLSKARLASNLQTVRLNLEKVQPTRIAYHYRECCPTLCDNLVAIIVLGSSKQGVVVLGGFVPLVGELQDTSVT